MNSVSILSGLNSCKINWPIQDYKSFLNSILSYPEEDREAAFSLFINILKQNPNHTLDSLGDFVGLVTQ